MYLLLPFAYLYQFFFSLNKLLYKIGIKQKYHCPLPVVVIGNITVGGTGKTPFTIELANLLKANGFKPGIISRGYKRKTRKSQWVTCNSNPLEAGDEPVLIAAKTKCPVAVSIKRSEAIKMLLAKSDCNIILADDGLQHHALKKDVEIVIVDGERKFGNGLCLPAGPLRESLKKLSTVDYIIYNDDLKLHHYSSYLKVGSIYNLLNESHVISKDEIKQYKVHAVAAIGHPDRFFNSLRQLGISFTEHIFPDHYQFKSSDFNFCASDEMIIMTQKDAIKCREFGQINYWVLPVRCEINQNFIDDFLKHLRFLLQEDSKLAKETVLL